MSSDRGAARKSSTFPGNLERARSRYLYRITFGQQIEGGPSLLSAAICGSQNFIGIERREPGCTLPWEGRVTGPRNLQELSFSFDDVHQIEVSLLPGRVVPLFRATWRELDLDTYRALISQLQQIGGRPSLLSAAICGKSKFYKEKELLEAQGTGAPYPGRVGSPVPWNLQEPLLSRSTMFIRSSFRLPGRVVPLFRATWRELDLDTYKILTSQIATDRREAPSLLSAAICGKSKFYSILRKEKPSSGDRCTLPWEGRVTGPLNLQELSFLVRRCSSDRGFLQLPGRAVPPFRATWRARI